MADILLELLTEEIPARFMGKMLAELKDSFQKKLTEARLTFAEVKTLGTDRRLAIMISGLSEQQPDVDKEVKGPPAEMAFKDGKLTPAGEGFCKKNNLDPKSVQKKEIGGKEYLYAKIFEKGKSAKEILPGLYQNVLSGLHLPIAMRWGGVDIQFIRPIHAIVSLYNKEILGFAYAGIAADKKTRGHRFIANKEVTIHSSAEYVAALEKNGVYVDQNLRRDMIVAQIKQIEQERKLKAIVPEELLWEVTYINECPKAVIAEIDEKYLSVPQECLIITMQKNQKYFPLLDAKGKLTKYFILISNNVNQKSLPNIIKGNVKVVTARLEDAKFFYEEDCKIKLETMAAGLKKVTYQEKIGTIYQKIERTVANALWLADALRVSAGDKKLVERTAWIAKGDLNSKMVYEFPELQGMMGAYYAKVQGEDPIVAQAIADHWKPRFAGDDLMVMSKIAAIVAIADKIDSIAGCFVAGLIPTSSSDPYALRRAAQGIVNILLTHTLDIDLKALIAQALSLFKNAEAKLTGDIYQFFKLRVKNVLQERNVAYDVIDCVLAVDHDDLFETIACAEQVTKAKANKTLVESAVRVASIIAKEKPQLLKSELLQLPEEQQLAKAITAVKDLDRLVAPISAFFDKILVMDPDQALKNNRIALLQAVNAVFAECGDWRKLVL
jgi:glycyl-tRNA synthetase beta chain